MKKDDLLLSCRGLDMAYGPVQILFGVDFDVVEGEMVALLGTNGAGKSTLLKGICGLVRPTAGTVTFGAGQNQIHTIEEYVEVDLFLQGCRMALALATMEAS